MLRGLEKNGGLAAFAFDEAHLISTWGHDFRPSYKKTEWIRTTFPNVQVTAATATATPKVLRDIKNILKLSDKSTKLIVSTFNRPNLFYEVRYKSHLDQKKVGGSLFYLMEFIKSQVSVVVSNLV